MALFATIVDLCSQSCSNSCLLFVDLSFLHASGFSVPMVFMKSLLTEWDLFSDLRYRNVQH
jgi:hypothetical protein